MITAAVVILSFLFLSFTTQSSIPLSLQEGNSITLLPAEAYLRGSIKSDGTAVTGWKGERNVVHWRFKCSEPGLYQVTLVHKQPTKDFSLSIHLEGNELRGDMIRKSESTSFGEITLEEGNHNLALQAHIGRKDKLPAVKSVLIQKSNEERK